MKPEATRILELTAGQLLARVLPALEDRYEQSTVGLMGILLTAAREELERGAERRVAENRALRRLFRDAAPAVSDPDLRRRLERASEGADPSLLLADLERANVELRELLISLHAHVEERDAPEARRIEAEIWRELAASTERRKLSLATF